ncbi:MAG: HAMP domain-containing sensor histidine kinase [bacterium]
MPSASKRSAARAIDSFDRRFRHSRLMLTLMYVAILAVILMSSGGITRSLFSYRLEGRFKRIETAVIVGTDRPLPPPMMEYLRADLLEATLIVNGLLLIVAGLLSYWLAGFTLRPIQAAYNRQRQFLSDASHELRTPLAILQTGLENELSSPEFSALRPAIRSHLEETERMGRLVCDFMVLSRLDGRDDSRRPAFPVDLRAVVAETVGRFGPVAEREGIVLRMDDGGSAVPVAVTDRELLPRVMANLIDNAIKYNRPGGSVDASVRADGRTAVVEVRDTGCGIPSDEQDKVFGRFYRAEKSRTRRTGGSGLGLAIVHSIVGSLGGGVSLESRPDSGTAVVVTLPVHRSS